MGSCSSIAEPVFAFQVPEIDFRLKQRKIFNSHQRKREEERNDVSCARKCLVVASDLLHVDVAGALDERLGGGVAVGDGDD